MMKTSHPEKSNWWLALVVLPLSLGTLLNSLVLTPPHLDWNITEWLIDYSHGFVRRGLPGQIIHWLADLGISPLVSIPVITGSLYSIAIIVLVRALFQQPILSRSEKLLSLLNPSLLIFYISDGSFLRKDLIPLVATLSFIALLSNLRRYSHKGYSIAISGFMFVLLNILVSLSHEALGLFLWFPINLVLWLSYLSQQGYSSKTLRLSSSFIFIFNLGLFLLLTRFRGDQAHVLAICEQWNNVLNLNCVEAATDMAAISALDWSISQQISQFSGLTIIDSGNFLLWLIPFGVWAGFNHRMAIRLTDIPTASYLLLGTTLAAIPLYIIAFDWGRYFVLQSLQIFSVCLLVPKSLYYESLKSFLTNIRSQYGQGLLEKSIATISTHMIQTKIYESKRWLIALTILIGMPHCCITLPGIPSKGLLGMWLVDLSRITQGLQSAFTR